MGATVLVNMVSSSTSGAPATGCRVKSCSPTRITRKAICFTSLTVIAALVGVRAGYPLLDPVAAIIVAGFIAHACWEIFQDTTRILSDQMVIAADDLQRVVDTVPEVLGCHQLRSRGSADHVFVDLHIWMDPAMRLDEAHRVSHVVKDRIMTAFPQIKDAVIHIEPPPARRERTAGD